MTLMTKFNPDPPPLFVRPHELAEDGAESSPTIVATSIVEAHTRTRLDGRLATRPDNGSDEGSL
jgi:hypothetical protein